MEYDIEKINRLLKNLTPRKISIISRLAGLNEDEKKIMKMKWLDGKTDIQICDEMNYSTATLTRKRKGGHKKILDALELYGLSDLSELPAEEILNVYGLFYKSQDELVRFFIRNRNDGEKQGWMLSFLKDLNSIRD